MQKVCKISHLIPLKQFSLTHRYTILDDIKNVFLEVCNQKRIDERISPCGAPINQHMLEFPLNNMNYQYLKMTMMETTTLNAIADKHCCSAAKTKSGQYLNMRHRPVQLWSTYSACLYSETTPSFSSCLFVDLWCVLSFAYYMLSTNIRFL